MNGSSRPVGTTRQRAWPWLVAAVVTALLAAQLSDSFGWPWWVRGLLFGLCLAGFGAKARRVQRQRHEATPS